MVNTQEVLSRLTSAGLLSSEKMDLGYVPTGIYALNKVVSGKYSGGYPIGGLTEIIGESSTGKTIFITHAFKEAQRLGYYTILIDNEFAYSPAFAETLGVDTSKLVYKTPDTVEKCFAAIENITKEIREHDPDTPIVVGFDSIGTAQSSTEAEQDMLGGSNMDGALRAKEVGRCLRKINPILRRRKVALIIINQVRNKVGVMYGDPTTRAGGGKSLEFYCAVSLKVNSNKSSDILRDQNKQPEGIKGKIVGKKNKVAIPFQECEFKLVYNEGLDPYFGLASQLEKDGLVSRAGGWYTLKSNDFKFQSKEFSALILDKSKTEFDSVRNLLGLTVD
jgi:recombination protein RecA